MVRMAQEAEHSNLGGQTLTEDGTMKLEVTIQNVVSHHSIMPLLRLIANNQRKIMANAQQLAEKVDALQTAIDTEQEQIQAALATLQNTIESLKAEILEGGTAAERQAIADKLDAAIADVSSTIADAAPVVEPAPEEVLPVDDGN